MKLDPGALIQRAVAVSPSAELNKQLVSSDAGVSSTCPSHLVPPYPVPTLSYFYQAAAQGLRLENMARFTA